MKNKDNMTLREISPNVFLFKYDTQYDLCMSFVRMQEFYESPHFKGRYFTLETFMDWWAKDQSDIKGSFDYPARWNGFNIPGEVVSNWLFECDEDILRPKELKILRKIAKRFKIKLDNYTDASTFHECLKYGLKDIYIIGVHKESSYSKEDINHELAHAFYTLYPKYRKKCQKLISKVDKDIVKYAMDSLIKKGYDTDFLDDEFQAYCSTGIAYGIHDSLINNFVSFKKSVKKQK